jgi:trimeric autotransporter adhesin
MRGLLAADRAVSAVKAAAEATRQRAKAVEAASRAAAERATAKGHPTSSSFSSASPSASGAAPPSPAAAAAAAAGGGGGGGSLSASGGASHVGHETRALLQAHIQDLFASPSQPTASPVLAGAAPSPLFLPPSALSLSPEFGAEAGGSDDAETTAAAAAAAAAAASLPTVERAKQRFREACVADGTGPGRSELSAKAFAAVVKALLKAAAAGSGFHPPSEADMLSAFHLADEDKSGSIDEGEFAKLYHLMLQGKVTGLGPKPLTPPAAAAPAQAPKKSMFFGSKASQTPSSAAAAAAAAAGDGDSDGDGGGDGARAGEFLCALKALEGALAPGELVSAAERAALEEQFNKALASAPPPSHHSEGGVVVGSLDRAAFTALLARVLSEACAEAGAEAPPTAALEEAFGVADTNGNGAIELDEFVVVAGVFLGQARKAAREEAARKARAEELKAAKIAEARERVRRMKHEAAERAKKAAEEAAAAGAAPPLGSSL